MNASPDANYATAILLTEEFFNGDDFTWNDRFTVLCADAMKGNDHSSDWIAFIRWKQHLIFAIAVAAITSSPQQQNEFRIILFDLKPSQLSKEEVEPLTKHMIAISKELSACKVASDTVAATTPVSQQISIAERLHIGVSPSVAGEVSEEELMKLYESSFRSGGLIHRNGQYTLELSTPQQQATAVKTEPVEEQGSSEEVTKLELTFPADSVAGAALIAIKDKIKRQLEEEIEMPAFISSSQVLVPIKIDLTYNGVRVVDSFCWDIRTPVMTPMYMASIMCEELKLSDTYAQRIALQIKEQVVAYTELVNLAFEFAAYIPNWVEKIHQLQHIHIGVRHPNLDFTDKIVWDPCCRLYTPEQFAEITVRDLKLPAELHSVIALKIRESLFKWLKDLLENPAAEQTALQPEFRVAETKVSKTEPQRAQEMSMNLWKRAKPNSADESASMPQPLLPDDTNSNASVWLQP